MKLSDALPTVLGAVLAVVLANAPGNASATPIYAPLVAGNTEFALNLFDQLAATNNANIFFSPYSISMCFGMVYAGAQGETAQQIATALGFDPDQAEVGPEFSALQAELATQQETNVITVSVANGLWAQTNFPFLPAFLDNAGTNYDASVQQVDFITDAAQITDQVNAWVASQTAGVISNALQPGTLNDDTRLALVNAIYFNGGWQNRFDTNLTVAAPFFVSANQTVSVPMMEQLETERYYEDTLLQAVELPYLNSNLTMVVLLPKVNGPLALSPAELSAALGGLVPRYLDVRLPKFKLETGLNLVPLLQNLGMADAFVAGAADFSGMDGGRDLYIGSATHKAVVEVNETGTIAAGVTVITIIPTFVPQPILFQADHPFIFLIRDTNSANILFMGQVANPAAGGASGVAIAGPLIQTGDGSFGFRNHQFGFNVGSTNLTLVVEACTNLASGIWFPIETLTLTNGSAYFSEPLPTNSPSRYYRVHAP